jgi:uncharacterized membrane protein
VWLAVVAMLIGSLVVAEVGRRAAAGTLPRNHVAGIRVRSTMRDDASWRTAHLAGGPLMLGSGILSAVLTVAAGAVGLVGGEGPAMALVLVAAAVLLVGVLASSRIGVGALRRAGRGEGWPGSP